MKDDNSVLSDLKLRLNLNYPELEECYAQGYEASQKEHQEDENPYREGTAEYRYWQEGWWAAFYGETPMAGAEVYLFDEPITQPQIITAENDSSANDSHYQPSSHEWMMNVLKLTGIIAASAVVGYQMFELVA